jgi:hypothetical protein
MKIGEAIHVLGTIVGIALGVTALVWQISASQENISIRPADGANGFHLIADGVSQDVEFIVVNESLSSVVVQRVEISPGNVFPPPVMIDGLFWDGRPFRIEPNQIMVFSFVAAREFNLDNTDEARRAEIGRPSNNGYTDLFNSFDHRMASEDRPDSQLHRLGILRLYESYLARDLQNALFAAGRTFDGDNPGVAKRLEDFPMYVTFGGPCLSYMIHTLSVCAGLEITTLGGNHFASEYIGFGLRSPELDRRYADQD